MDVNIAPFWAHNGRFYQNIAHFGALDGLLL